MTLKKFQVPRVAREEGRFEMDWDLSGTDITGTRVKWPVVDSKQKLQPWEPVLLCALLLVQDPERVKRRLSEFMDHSNWEYEFCEVIEPDDIKIKDIDNLMFPLFMKEYLRKKFEIAFDMNGLRSYLLTSLWEPRYGPDARVLRGTACSPFIQMVFAGQSPFKVTYSELINVLPLCGFPVRDIMRQAKGEEDEEFADEALDFEYVLAYADNNLIPKKYGGYSTLEPEEYINAVDRMMLRLCGARLDEITGGDNNRWMPAEAIDLGDDVEPYDPGQAIDPEDARFMPLGVTLSEAFVRSDVNNSQ